MGWMYEHGEGVVKDKMQALQWYRFAAEQGHPLACDKMAHFYDAGIVVAQDKDEAVRWFRRALLGGLAQAEHDLARLSANQDTNNVPEPSSEVAVASTSSAVAVASASSAVAVASASVLPAPVTTEKSEAALLGVQCAHRSSAASAGANSATMQLRVKSTSKESELKS
jgi:TPR repeat protein